MRREQHVGGPRREQLGGPSKVPIGFSLQRARVDLRRGPVYEHRSEKAHARRRETERATVLAEREVPRVGEGRLDLSLGQARSEGAREHLRVEETRDRRRPDANRGHGLSRPKPLGGRGGGSEKSQRPSRALAQVAARATGDRPPRRGVNELCESDLLGLAKPSEGRQHSARIDGQRELELRLGYSARGMESVRRIRREAEIAIAARYPAGR